MLPHTTFHAPSRFHPGYSLLGRWLHRRTGDRRRAEALHLLLVTGLVLVLVFGHFLGSALLAATATPQATMAYWLVQTGFAGLVLVTGVVGFRPALTVTCTADALCLEQGARTLAVPHAALTSARRITARRFHRHEHRYAATCIFLGVLGDEVLLLHRTHGGPVIIGLPERDLAALHRLLEETARVPTRTESAPVKGGESALEKE